MHAAHAQTLRRPEIWLLRLAPLYATATISAIVAVGDPIGGTPFLPLESGRGRVEVCIDDARVAKSADRM